MMTYDLWRPFWKVSLLHALGQQLGNKTEILTWMQISRLGCFDRPSCARTCTWRRKRLRQHLGLWVLPRHNSGDDHKFLKLAKSCQRPRTCQDRRICRLETLRESQECNSGFYLWTNSHLRWIQQILYHAKCKARGRQSGLFDLR